MHIKVAKYMFSKPHKQISDYIPRANLNSCELNGMIYF